MMLSLLLFASGAAAASLDPTNSDALSKATQAAMKNLISYYSPTSDGVFNQVQTPWHESGIIWGTFFDYLKWSGDSQFSDTVTGALVNASYNSQQDFLGGSLASLNEKINGRWNDDILWPAQATVAGAEVYGSSATMPGAGGPWTKTGQTTFDEAWEQWDDQCGGGIYWSRDRSSQSKNYKSVITNLEFMQVGARQYIQQKNDTALGLAEQTLDWVMGASKLADPSKGTVQDGTNAGACDGITTSQWSYNYGEMIGALAWMHKATNNQTYLDMATPFLNTAISLFATPNNGVIAEQCETGSTPCDRDQQGFKAVLVRNMAYLYRETSDSTVKDNIAKTIDSTLASMASKSCDDSWNCGGNWTTDNGPVKYVRSQGVSAALLVAAMGVHTSGTGNGLLTTVNAPAPSVNSTGTPSSGPGSGTSGGNGAGGRSAPVVVGMLVGCAVLGALGVGL